MGNWFASQCGGHRQVNIDQDVESSFIIHCQSSCCNRKWFTRKKSQHQPSASKSDSLASWGS